VPFRLEITNFSNETNKLKQFTIYELKLCELAVSNLEGTFYFL